MRQFIKSYNYFYIFICIIWHPLQSLYLGIDGAGRSILMLSVLAIIFNINGFRCEKKIYKNSAFFFWVLLLFYSMLNSFFKGFNAKDGFITFYRQNYWDPFILLIITMLELRKDGRACLKLIRGALIVYLVLCLPFFGFLMDFDRFGVEAERNLFPLHAICLLFVSSIIFLEKESSLFSFVTIAVFVTLIMLLTGSRKAFGAEVIIFLGVILNNGKKRSVDSWIRIGIFSIILVLGVRNIMNNSLVGDRINEEMDKEYYVHFVDNQVINGYIMKFLGDRAIQYESAIALFHGHFWTGIGLTNFIIMSDIDLVLHSEYMVQLCENGFIGFILLMLFYYNLLALIRHRPQKKGSAGMTLFGLISVLFINFTSWTYCMNYAMVLYAITLVYASSINERMTTFQHGENDFNKR